MNDNFLKKLLRPSTREFIKEAQRTQNYSFFDFLHGYIYGRWIYPYIAIALGEHPFARKLWRLSGLFNRRKRPPEIHTQQSVNGSKHTTLADSYHGKVMPLEAAKQLINVQQDICLTNLEQVIPYAHAKDIILHNPSHIVALECPCRTSRPNPCHPLDVCLVVGEPFAGFVAENHASRSRWITQAEAIEILEAEHERGHVHHAFFKDAMLGRYYAICNCCSCCCGAMQAWRNGLPMLASSGYISQIDEDSCIGCGNCVDYCQFKALSLDDYVAVVDLAQCMGCGVCASKCDEEAILLVREPGKGVPLEIRQLLMN